MAFNNRERELHNRFELVKEELAAATPGFLLQVYQSGKLKIDMAWGKHWKFYDLASMTKIIFTASVCARAINDLEIKAKDAVYQHWPSFPHKKIQLQDLWTHTAGLPWWRPFYKKLKGPMDADRRWAQLNRELLRLKKTKVSKAVYSDPDLLVTSQVLQNVKQQSLQEMWHDYARPDWTGQMHFNIQNKPMMNKSDYAPTEKCSWRKKILQGQVHDENTFALGGIAPHAGLFGRPDDVAQWAMQWRKSLRGENEKFIPQRIAKIFTKRQTPRSIGDWGYLFMKPTAGRASCGKHFSSQSFGHTGFTGTSIWFDPNKDLQVILLSNRVNPTRNNTAFAQWRPWIHNAVCETL